MSGQHPIILLFIVVPLPSGLFLGLNIVLAFCGSDISREFFVKDFLNTVS